MVSAFQALAALPNLVRELRDCTAALSSLVADARQPGPSASNENCAVSIPELARRAGISRSRIYKSLADGSLASVKIGNRRIIPADAAENFLKGGGPSIRR